MRVRASFSSIVCAAVLSLACGSNNSNPGADGGAATDGGASTGDCPSGLVKMSVGGVEMCSRAPTDEAVGYNVGTDTTTCGDPLALNFSCFTNRPTAPAMPATVTLEGYVDTFGLEKATTGVSVQVRSPDGTVIGTATSDGNHRCARTKTAGSKTVIVAGYTLANVPTNQLLVFKNTGPEFRDTYTYGRHFNTNECVNAQTITDDTCHSGCFIRNGQYVFRYDANIISNQTWTLIPLTAGYNRGIAPGNAAFAGQIHDCNDNQIMNASVGFTPNANAKVLTYFNGNCEDPNANNAKLFTNRDSLYAGLDAQPTPAGQTVKVSGIARSGGNVVNVGIYDVQFFPNSVTLLTLSTPLPIVVGGTDGGTSTDGGVGVDGGTATDGGAHGDGGM